MSVLANLRVVIADDHALLLGGLQAQLTAAGILVVGQAADGTNALQLIMDKVPDMAILDIEMPYMSGLAIAKHCKDHHLETKIILLSMHKEQEFVAQAMQLGISGYVLKEDTTIEIMSCIEAVSKGEMYFSNVLSEDKNKVEDIASRYASLTPSERKILKLIAQKNNTSEIAELLFISERTVEKHRSNLVSKLNLSGQSNSLTYWAIENKTLLNGL